MSGWIDIGGLCNAVLGIVTLRIVGLGYGPDGARYMKSIRYGPDTRCHWFRGNI